MVVNWNPLKGVLCEAIQEDGKVQAKWSWTNSLCFEKENHMKLGELKRNKEKHGVEIYFSVKPEKEIRDAMKENGFRYNPKKVCWYAKETSDTLAAAKRICDVEVDGEIEVIKPKADKPKVNKFGVKVGTLFSASWGYDQTNVDFFQVVELVGETSVRVREVKPIVVGTDATGPMAEDIVVKTNADRLLEPTSFSVFIKDQEKGDLKRLKSYAQDGVSDCCFTLSSFASAYICKGETEKYYTSWYA